MKPSEILKQKRDEIILLGQKYGVYNIRVFGSIARGEDKEDSDVDLLVSLSGESDYFDLGGFKESARESMGKSVDVMLDTAIYDRIKPTILAEAKPL